MRNADAIIVGGGPAGSTCASRLVGAGASVVVLDRAVFPRDKVCAGWITPQVVASLHLDVDEYRRHRTYQPIHAFRVGRLGSDAAVLVDYGREVSVGIRRCELDAYLLARCGADVHAGTAVRTMRRESQQWIVNDEWTAPLLVGAAGSECPVARMLNAPTARDHAIIVAKETEFPLDAGRRQTCRVESGVAELYFTDDLLGYGWCVRKGNIMNVGIGRLDRRLPRTDVDAFAGFVRQSRGVTSPGVDHWRGHSYMAGVPGTYTRIADGVLLVGDAAGLASDRSGEGIGPAVESAIMAADVIAAARGDLGEANLAAYAAQVADRWRTDGGWSAVARVFPAAVIRSLGAALLKRPAFVARVVLDRWFLHAHERPWRAA